MGSGAAVRAEMRVRRCSPGRDEGAGWRSGTEMEIRDLRALLAVVRSGSFTAAARELGYTQPAISQQVAALELDVGQPLVQRRPVRATPAGERLAEHAARILLRLDVARSELSSLGEAPGEVRVGVCPLAAPDLLAAGLRDLRGAYPLLRVRVRPVSAGSAVADVAVGTVDAALADGITAPNEPLHLADAGLLTLLALVAAGLGAALLPASAGPLPDGVTAIPLRSPRLVHRTELLALRTASARQRLVIDALAAQARAF